MKTILSIAMVVLAVSSSVSAKSLEFVAKKATKESMYCIDVASGQMSLADIATKANMTVTQLTQQVKCNGLPIRKFIALFEQNQTEDYAIVTDQQFALSGVNANNDAALCLAAASGDLNKLKLMTRSQGMSIKQFAKFHQCNQQPVVDFVEQYGQTNAALQLKKYI